MQDFAVPYKIVPLITSLFYITWEMLIVSAISTWHLTNAARAELCCHKLCLARRRKTKSTGSRIGEAKWVSEASSAWAADVKRCKGIALTAWCANRSCWQMRKGKWVSEASSAWAAYVKRCKGIAPAAWCANRSCWQMREVKWGRRLSYAND